MKVFRLLFVMTGILTLQTMVLDKYQWLQLLDLFLLLNVYFALNFNQVVCMSISIPSGLLQDAFSTPEIIGMNAFSKTVVVFLISGLSSRLMLKHPLLVLVLIFVSTLMDSMIIYGLHILFSRPYPLDMRTMLIASSLNSLLGLFSFQIADRFRIRKEYA